MVYRSECEEHILFPSWKHQKPVLLDILWKYFFAIIDSAQVKSQIHINVEQNYLHFSKDL